MKLAFRKHVTLKLEFVKVFDKLKCHTKKSESKITQ